MILFKPLRFILYLKSFDKLVSQYVYEMVISPWHTRLLTRRYYFIFKVKTIMSLIVYADDDTSITMTKMIPDTTGSFSLFSRLRGYKLFIYIKYFKFLSN